MVVARAGDVEAIRLLLQYGAEPDFGNPVDKKQTALMVAAAAGNLPAVVQLVVGGADLDRADEMGQMPLNYAFSHGQQHVVEWMQSKGATLRVVSPAACRCPLASPPCPPPRRRCPAVPVSGLAPILSIMSLIPTRLARGVDACSRSAC